MRAVTARNGGRSPALWQIPAAAVWLILFIAFSFTLELLAKRARGFVRDFHYNTSAGVCELVCSLAAAVKNCSISWRLSR